MDGDTGGGQVAAMRRFNRFYTQKIGVLEEGHLKSPLSLTEARVLYELAHRESPTAAAIGRDLGLDPGYLSRILARFGKRGYVARTPSDRDARQTVLALTETGRLVLEPLEEATNRKIGAMLEGLAPSDRDRLLTAMRTIETVLGDAGADPSLLRPPGPGDLGWVVHRQGLLYALDYGWDATFEGLLAGIVADFVRDFDARRDRCWIAERSGAVAGSVFIVHEGAAQARLRLLYVEPWARGLGIGRRLVDEAVRWARQVGYRRIVLWTNDILAPARRIYQAAGFVMVEEKAHHSFGQDLVSETWQMDL